MKTIEQRDAAIHARGMLMLSTFFSFAWFSLDPEALPHVIHHLESQWLHLSNWVSSGMMNPHRTQW